jgi:hypothetical protein
VSAPADGRLHRFAFGGNRLAIPAAAASDATVIVERLAARGVSLDLAEPFDRIREAIREAQRESQLRPVTEPSPRSGVAEAA